MSHVGGLPTVGLSMSSPRRNLRQEVNEILRTSLISGILAPEVMYSAPRLAAQFGVSATPVRDAMLDLTRAAGSSCAEQGLSWTHSEKVNERAS